MDISTARSIIGLLLRGSSLGEIAKKVSLARSTVQEAIAKWKAGQIAVYAESIPYVDQITEMAKWLRNHNMKIEDLVQPFLNASAIESIGIDLESLAAFYEALKDKGPEIVPALVNDVVALKDGGLDPSKILEETMRIQRSLEQLRNDVANVNAEMGDLNEKRESIIADITDQKESLAYLKSEITDLAKQRDDLLRTISGIRERIDRSERFWNTAATIGVDPDSLEQFMRKAHSLGYDARRIQHLKDIEDYGLERGMAPGDLRHLVLSIMDLDSAGWNSSMIIALSTALRGIADKPEKVIRLMGEYARHADSLKRSIRDLTEKQKNLSDEIARKTSDVSNLTQRKASLEEEITGLEEELIRRNATIGELKKLTASYTQGLESVSALNAAVHDLSKRRDALLSELEDLRSDIDRIGNIAGLAQLIPEILEGKKQHIIDFIDKYGRLAKESMPTGEITEEMRIIISEALLEAAGDKIAVASYRGYGRVIPGEEYDKVMQFLKKRREMEKVIDDMKGIREGYGRDIRSFLDDLYTGKIPAESGAFRFASDVMKDLFDKDLRKSLSEAKLSALMAEERGYSGTLFFATPAFGRGGFEVGKTLASDLVHALSAGDQYVTAKTPSGSVPVDICYVILQLFHQGLFPRTTEELRKRWREEARKTDTAKNEIEITGWSRVPGFRQQNAGNSDEKRQRQD